MNAPIVTAIRFLAVTILYFSSFAVVSGALLSTASRDSGPAEPNKTLLALLSVSLINAAVWTYVILRSRWSGWKLIASVFIVFYGVNTLMPQIETAYFITRLPPGMLPRLFLAGAIMGAVFAPLAVLVLGKVRAAKNSSPDHSGRKILTGNWVLKLCLIVLAYVIIYFTFGYFIAWKNLAVQAYYGGSDPGSFIAHLRNVLHEEPFLFLLQAVRGLLWTAIAAPVIKMTKGRKWEAGLAVALLFAAVNSQLLIPNPLMPAEVRMVHLIETATSNFLFGWLVVLITTMPSRHKFRQVSHGI